MKTNAKIDVEKLAESLGSSVVELVKPLSKRVQVLEEKQPPQGEPGQRGEKGDPGERGEKGLPGSDGAKGDAGEPGPRGEKGDAGPPGERGEKGDAGEPGPRGEKGDVGEPGQRGEKGDPGEPGDRGEKGDVGKYGEKGDPGERGTAGEKGDPGVRGERGADGEPGGPGERGQPGDVGPRGEKGERGDSGIPGERGPPGESVAGPRGEKGDPGDRGERGEKGDAGRSVTVDDVRDFLDAGLAKWLLEAERMFTRRVDEFITALPRPKDGVDGLSADDLTLDLASRTFSLSRGGAVIKSFFVPFPKYEGVWREGEYAEGLMVTFGGSIWIARRSTTSKPGSDDSWTLCIKKGRDGRDAK